MKPVHSLKDRLVTETPQHREATEAEVATGCDGGNLAGGSATLTLSFRSQAPQGPVSSPDIPEGPAVCGKPRPTLATANEDRSFVGKLNFEGSQLGRNPS